MILLRAVNGTSPGEYAYTLGITARQLPLLRVTAMIDASEDEHRIVAGRRYFDLELSESIQIGYRDMRDHAFTITSGSGEIRSARRVITLRKCKEKNSGCLYSDHWRIGIKPSNSSPITVTLTPKDCDQDGALCTPSGGKLAGTTSVTLRE